MFFDRYSVHNYFVNYSNKLCKTLKKSLYFQIIELVGTSLNNYYYFGNMLLNLFKHFKLNINKHLPI